MRILLLSFMFLSTANSHPNLVNSPASISQEMFSQCFSSDIKDIPNKAQQAGAGPHYKVNFDSGFFEQITYTLESTKSETSTGKTFYTEWSGQIANRKLFCQEISGQAYFEAPCRYCIEFMVR